MKYSTEQLVEIASTVEPIQDGRIHIEKINGPFLFSHGGSPAEYGRPRAGHRPRLALEARVRSED